MKKFVVIHARKSMFRKGEVSTYEDTFDHAIDAWRCYTYYREYNTRDGRWPILSLEIVLR